MSVTVIPREFTRSNFVMALIEQVFELGWSAEASAKLIVDVLRNLDNFTFQKEDN